MVIDVVPDVGVPERVAPLWHAAQAAGVALHREAPAHRPRSQLTLQAVAAVDAQHVLGRVLAVVLALEVGGAFGFQILAGVEGIAGKQAPVWRQLARDLHLEAAAAHLAFGCRVPCAQHLHGTVLLRDLEDGKRQVQPVVEERRLGTHLDVVPHDRVQDVVAGIHAALDLEDLRPAGVGTGAFAEVPGQARIGRHFLLVDFAVDAVVVVRRAIEATVIVVSGTLHARISGTQDHVPRIGHVEARTQGDAMLPDLVVEVGIRIQRGLAGPVGLYQRGMVEVPDVVGRAVQRPAPVGIILLP